MTELTKRIQMLDVGAVYMFYEVDLSAWGQDEPLRLHCNGIEQVLNPDTNVFEPQSQMTYRGHVYDFLAIDLEGTRLSNDGKVNVPTLRIMNNVNGQQGAVSALLEMYNGLRGAKVTFRFTTEEAYKAGTLQEFVQYWWIDRPLEEDIDRVSFELTSPLDYKRQPVPTRLIMDICTWSLRGQYRGEACGYTGDRYFDERGNPVDSIVLDVCGGTCNDCILRFGRGNPINHGGFLIPNRTNF